MQAIKIDVIFEDLSVTKGSNILDMGETCLTFKFP